MKNDDNTFVAQVKGHDTLGTANVATNWARQLQRHDRHTEAGLAGPSENVRPNKAGQWPALAASTTYMCFCVAFGM